MLRQAFCDDLIRDTIKICNVCVCAANFLRAWFQTKNNILFSEFRTGQMKTMLHSRGCSSTLLDTRAKSTYFERNCPLNVILLLVLLTICEGSPHRPARMTGCVLKVLPMKITPNEITRTMTHVMK